MKSVSAGYRCALSVLASIAFLFSQSVFSQGREGDEVLVENSYAKVTRADYEAELLRLPPDLRTGFANNGKRVYDLVSRLLLTKSLAAEARKGELSEDPVARRRVALEVERVEAGLQVARIEEDAGRAFDARRPQLEARAREIYLVNHDKYRIPEQVSVSHILFDTKRHTADEALKLAIDARARLLAGADFTALSKQISDDPTVMQNGGHLDFFDREQMDPAFSRAAFALKNVNDLSEPVRSSFGYHLIRLDGRRPAGMRTFEQVKASILAEERKKYVDEQKEIALASLREDPATKVNQAALDALIIRIDPVQVEKLSAPEKPN